MPSHQWLDGYAVVGMITRPWGVRGQLRMHPYGDGPERYRSSDSFYIGLPHSQTIRPVAVSELRPHQNSFLLQLQEINTPEEAEALRNVLLLVAEADRPPLPQGHHYFSDLAGLSAVDSLGHPLGVVIAVEEQPSVNSFLIEVDGKQVYAPWVEGCIGEINLEAKTVVVDVDYLNALLETPPAPGEH